NSATCCKSPLKIAEYLASGKPMVASKVGEVESMVGEAGILVTPGDTAALAEKIEFLVSNKDLRAGLGKEARIRAENIYNWEKSSERLLEAYQAALRR
ncbi:glycosyltransferase, partial [bacterium]